MTTSQHSRGVAAHRWRWVGLAALVGVVVFFVTSITQGVCFDSADPAKSYCESGPAIGVAGTWVAWIAYVAFAAYCIAKAVRVRKV
ncbi:hypothetical protein [Agromyces sp. Marseille-Q5079]|uniref:hypothetical protein n=1 Tax=Agromyces sp. Marseille-Q5079 TaxID=3439059 RepID=UPI003D9CBDA0